MSDRKKMIQQGFDTVASGYDHPSLFFFPETAKRMIAHLDLAGDESLLDVCTGTGVVALTAAEKLTQGSVTGIDLSSGMLQQAKQKASDQQLSNTDFIQMDLEQLSFPEQHFDVATSSFGLFFLEDMKQGLTSIASRVKSGGKVAISSFTGDAFSPMSEMFIECYESFGKEVPPLSWKRLCKPEHLEDHFNHAGIQNVSIHHEALGYHMKDKQMWWDVVWNAGYRNFLNQLTDEQVAEFKIKHLAAIEKLLGDEGVWFNTEVLIAVGQKSA